jgi:hypothetical protein
MRTVMMILALTFAASDASAETAKPAAAHARVPHQAKRSTPAPKPLAKAPPAAPAAPTLATEVVAADTTAPAPATQAAAPVATDAPAESAEPAATTSAPATSAPVTEAEMSDEPAEHAVKVPLPAKPPTAIALSVEYQRVGRSILKLQDQRGKFDCGNLQQRFKAIKLDSALATPASRMQLYVTLTELSMKLERMRGIKLDSACLANPLAPGCM